MTKKERKQVIRELIGSYDVGQRFSDPDCERFGNTCGYEFEWVKRVSPKQGKAMAVHVYWPTGNYTGSWSWVKSIDGYDQRQNVLNAMRTVSRTGTFADVIKDVCAQCGTSDRLTVDHKTTPFAKIVEIFIREYGEPDIVNIEFGWQLVDPELFLKFHDRIADYQVLCISCNAKKGVGTR
ncbi:MAG: hypothetical protein R3F02_11740 [Thiolinea sp.]